MRLETAGLGRVNIDKSSKISFLDYYIWEQYQLDN